MLYVLAVFLPFVVFFQSGRPGLGLINLCLWLTCLGAPFASAWALFQATQYLSDVRTGQIVDAIRDRDRVRRRSRRDDDDEDE